MLRIRYSEILDYHNVDQMGQDVNPDPLSTDPVEAVDPVEQLLNQ